MTQIVDQTWNELRCRVRPLFHTLFVRTEPPQTVSAGGVHYPGAHKSFYEGPLHLRLITGTVVAAGPGVREPKVGERVCFQRKYFVRWKTLEDGTFVGWMQMNEVTGILDPALSVDKFLSFAEGPKAIRMDPV